MISSFIEVFKNKDTRAKILFTMGMLLVYRLGCALVVPGIDNSMINLSGNTILNMMSLLGGGAISQMSVFALGVGPYITASIIIQLLSMDVIPYLTELAKEGNKGRQKMDRYTRYLAVVMSLVQGYFITRTLNATYSIIENDSFAGYAYVSIMFTAGTMFLLWIGDRITAKGIGNGTSLIIFSGIVANLPYTFRMVFASTVGTQSAGWLLFTIYLVMYLLIIVLVTVMQLAERRIPIQYTSSSVQNRTKGDMNHLPLKVNSASVIPVIFSSALLQAPQIILSWINYDLYDKWSKILNLTHPYMIVFYALLITLFTFFYTNLEVDPSKISERLSKQNGYIPGVRPGKETREYISNVLNRITVLGAIFLVFIAVLPYIVSGVSGLPTSAALGGTGIIIVVGIAIETHKGLVSQLTQKSYKGFIGR
jgi:preprotein translocase subunit SecY